jgi:hypothetical protein
MFPTPIILYGREHIIEVPRVQRYVARSSLSELFKGKRREGLGIRLFMLLMLARVIP